METAVEASTEAAQMFGHGNKTFRGGTGFSTRLLLGLIDIGAASHKDLGDLLGVALEVLGTAEAEIGDSRARIRVHALSKALQGWPIEGCVVGLANEVVGGDHKALAVEGHLQGGAKFRAGMTLALLDGAGIKVIERDQAMGKVTFPGQFLLGLRIEEIQDLTQVAPSLPQGAFGKVIEVRCKTREGGDKQGVELSEIDEAVLLMQVVGPPALFDMELVPPQVELGISGEGRHFVKGLIEEPDVSGIHDRAFQDGGVHEHHVGVDDRRAFEVRKDLVFNDQGPFCAEALSPPAQRRGVHKGHEAVIGDIAKVLHVAVFLNRFDHFSITEVAQSSEDGGGDQEAEGVSRAPFVRVVERDEALNDGLPRDHVAQDDQIMGGVRQVSLDPLRTKRVFECLYYHGKDLCVGCREMLCSTLSHRSEVTETCPGRENQQILDTENSTLLDVP
jgi:hypothetical protein